MHIIVVGAGEVGSYVAELLVRHGNDVAVIETDPGRLDTLAKALDVLVVPGSGTHPEVLQRAGLDEADLLVAVTSNDEVNMISALLAKQAGVKQTVIRIESEELRGRAAQQLRQAIGADLVIDPDAETASAIMDLLEAPGASDIAYLANREVMIIGAILTDQAPIVGQTLSEVAARYEPDWDWMVAALRRGDTTVIPRSEETMQVGDHVWLVSKRSARNDVMKQLGLARAQNRRIMILGGGHTAEVVAEKMAKKSNVDVTVVELRPERARQLAERLEGVLVLEGDITDADMLQQERVGDYDAVLALTGYDDANILACLYARSQGATETIAIVHRLLFQGLLEEVGIDVALSPRTATANGVLRFLRGNVAAVATFLSGDFEVLEVEVLEGSGAEDVAIKDLHLPKNVLIGAFVRDGKAQIARGRTVMRKRDHVVLFVRAENAAAVRELFG